MKCGMMYSNINGFKGKSVSIQTILQKLESGMVVLCEVKLENVNKVKEVLPQYQIIDRCIKLGKGGVVIAVKRNTFGSFTNVTNTGNQNILVARLGLGSGYFRIIAAYAPQEADLKDEREPFFEELSMEVARSQLCGDQFVVIGDLNAKISEDADGNVVADSSPNGNLLLNIVQEYHLKFVNFSTKCSGKWTHVVRTSGEASCLDYVLTTNDFLQKNVQSMLIDETCMLCPFSLKKSRGKDVCQYSDHNTILVDMILPRSRIKNQKKSGRKWKLNDEGLALFHEKTNREIESDLSSYDDEKEHDYDGFERYIERTMHECFRSVKISSSGSSNDSGVNKSTQKIIKKLMKIYEQGKIQRKVVKMYISVLKTRNEKEVSKMQADILAKRLNQLSLDDKLSLDGFWKLKKSYTKNSSIVSSVINDKGIEVCGPTGILNEFRNEFINRLKPAKIRSGLESFEERTLELYQRCVEEAGKVISDPFTNKELDHAISQLKSRKATPDNIPPEVFIHGGKELRVRLLKVLNAVKEEQVTPAQWEVMKITPLYKGKGSVKELVNQRGIFLSTVVSKLFEKLIKVRIAEFTAKISVWQAGATEERSAQDQTFLLRSAVNHAIYLNKPLFLTLYDFRQCFDKMWLEDAVLSLWKLGVRDDMLKLISLLNTKSVASVKTSVGETEEFVLGPNTKQGTVLGPILSSASVAECCDEIVSGGASIGELMLRILAFVDDLLGLNHYHKDVHESHECITAFADKKRMGLNEDKCVILPVNVPDSMAVPVLVVNGKEMDIVEFAKYLGDVFNRKGTNSDMIDERVRKGLVCMISTIALTSEITLGIHLITTLISLYKIIFLQVVTFNSGAWNNLTSSEINRLQVVQLKFLKRILHAPTSTCNCITFLELGILPIEFNININQLRFLHHILTLDENDPVRCAYNQQKLFPYENNWYNEVTFLRSKYSLFQTDEEISVLSKEKWKSLVKVAVNEYALVRLNLENSEKKKTSHLSPYTELLPQKYFEFLSPADSRLFFSVRSGTLDIKSLRKYNYSEEDTLCRLCGFGEETIEHIVNDCVDLPKADNVEDVFSLERESVQIVVRRVKNFIKLSEEREKEAVPIDLGNT